MLALLFAILSVWTQGAFSQCFELRQSKSCAGFEGSFIAPSSEYKDMESFEKFVESRHDLNRNYISVFGSAFACPRYSGAGQRHHMPIFCALIIEHSAPMCKKAIKTPICRDTCREALFGLAELFENRQICDGSMSAPRLAKQERLRQETLLAYTDLCKSLKIRNKAQGQCVDGVNAQLGETCGFVTQREADQFCKLSPQSPCCKSLGSKRVLAAGIQAKAAQNGTESGSGTNNGQTNASPSITLSTAQSSTPTSVASTTTSAAASSETAAADTSSGTSSDPSSSGTPEKTAEQEESDAASAAALEEEEQKKKILIIGASVGSFVLLMAVITCWACASRRRQKSDSDSVFGQSYATGSHLSLGSSSMKSSPVTPMSDNIMKNIGGNTVQVVKAYNPNLSDEVQLRVGDSIKILEAYDDGWAFGQNTTTNQKGAFPMACLNVRLSHDASEDPKKIRLRMSSLYNGTGMHPPPI